MQCLKPPGNEVFSCIKIYLCSRAHSALRLNKADRPSARNDCMQDNFARARTRPKIKTARPSARATIGYLVYKRNDKVSYMQLFREVRHTYCIYNVVASKDFVEKKLYNQIMGALNRHVPVLFSQ